MPNIALTSFNAGELSPQIDARSDVEKYASGCRTLENMIPRIYGGVERRPGTMYIADCETGSVASRVVPFIFSSTIAYILEFGDQVIRVYFDGEVIGDDIVSPYLEDDLPQLQFKQSADVMWIVHPSYAPRKFTRTTVTTFDLSEIAFDKGPFLTRNDFANDDDVTLAVTGYTVATVNADVAGTGYFTIESATDISGLFPANRRYYVSASTNNDGGFTVNATTATTYVGTTLTVYANEIIAVGGAAKGQIMVAGGTVTLTASSDTFITGTDGHAGALFKLTQKRIQTVTSGSAVVTGVIGSAIDAKGDFTFNTHGIWAATIELQRNEDGTNWETFRTYPASNDRNIQQPVVESADNVQYRINVTSYTSGTVSADITVDRSTQDGILRISTVASTTSATAIAVVPMPSTAATKRWAEGAWSAVRGYPTTFTFFEERGVYGGTANDTQQIWLSATGDFENFEEGVKDADSFSLVLPEPNAIRWIEALDALVIGTAGGEWRIRATTIDAALTPDNFNIRQQTPHGSTDIQAVKANNAVLFVDFVARKVREMVYVDQNQKYEAPDLTALAEHITEGGITGIAYQRNPDSILWCVRSDGVLLSMTYEREQDVVAWARHLIGGDGVVESVAVIPSSTEDEVWLTVRRSIGVAGVTTVRYIEQMQPRAFGEQKDAFFVDAGIVVEPDAVAQLITYIGYDIRYGEGPYGEGPYGGVPG